MGINSLKLTSLPQSRPRQSHAVTPCPRPGDRKPCCWRESGDVDGPHSRAGLVSTSPGVPVSLPDSCSQIHQLLMTCVLDLCHIPAPASWNPWSAGALGSEPCRAEIRVTVQVPLAKCDFRKPAWAPSPLVRASGRPWPSPYPHLEKVLALPLLGLGPRLPAGSARGSEPVDGEGQSSGHLTVCLRP